MRPDVIDEDRGLIWELKPISHSHGPNIDYIQITTYLYLTGHKYCMGDSHELVAAPGTQAYPIIDYRGRTRDVSLFPGEHGFIYYELGAPQKIEIADEAKESLRNTIVGGLVIIGEIIYVLTAGS